MNIFEIIKHNNNEKTVIIYKNHAISYKQLNRMIEEQSAKINTPQNVIAIYINNSIQYVIAYFSVLSLNKTVMPLAANMKLTEILNFLKIGGVSFVITNNAHFKKMKNYDELSHVTIYNIDSGEIIYPEDNGSVIDEILNDVAILMPTSGSTGQPKMAMLTHENLFFDVYGNIASLSIKDNDISYISLPMCYSYCNTAQFLSHLYVGATIVIQNSAMHIPTIINDMNTFEITNYFCNPTIVNMLIEHLKLFPNQLPKIKSICIGTAAVSKIQLEKLISLLPNINCYLTYGLTEASPRVSTYLVDKNNIQSSVGKPFEGINVRIIDDNGNDVGKKQVGQLIIQGANVMKGYYRNNEETKKTIVDGWLYTGDYAVFDSEMNITIKGRKKNTINCSGVNVYPEEIEQALIQHDAIKDIYVYGQPDDFYGETVFADVILFENIDEKKFFNSIEAFCLQNLSNIKVPKFRLVDNISKTITNKNKRMR